MQLQKCRTCGERHRVGPCPSYGNRPDNGQPDGTGKLAKGVQLHPDPPKKKCSKQETCSPVVLVEAMSARDKPTLGQLMIAGVQEAIDMVRSEKKKRAPAGSFDRKVYQREYMRKRRARHQPPSMV